MTFLDIASGQMFAANAIGARIWQHLESGRSEPQIVAALAEQFGDIPSLAADVRRFIDVLEARGFVRRQGAA